MTAEQMEWGRCLRAPLPSFSVNDDDDVAVAKCFALRVDGHIACHSHLWCAFARHRCRSETRNPSDESTQFYEDGRSYPESTYDSSTQPYNSVPSASAESIDASSTQSCYTYAGSYPKNFDTSSTQSHCADAGSYPDSTDVSSSQFRDTDASPYPESLDIDVER